MCSLWRIREQGKCSLGHAKTSLNSYFSHPSAQPAYSSLVFSAHAWSPLELARSRSVNCSPSLAKSTLSPHVYQRVTKSSN